LRLQVEAILEDGLHALVAHGTRRAGRTHVNLGVRMLARHRVVVAANIDVVLDADPCPPIQRIRSGLPAAPAAGWSISAQCPVWRGLEIFIYATRHHGPAAIRKQVSRSAFLSAGS
jgi:hypothetical protein